MNGSPVCEWVEWHDEMYPEFVVGGPGGFEVACTAASTHRVDYVDHGPSGSEACTEYVCAEHAALWQRSADDNEPGGWVTGIVVSPLSPAVTS